MGALALAELGTMLPQSGGLYVYMREAYGPFWAFLYGWTIMLVVIPGSLAALSSAFLLYLEQFVPLTLWEEKSLGIAVLLGLGFVNARGVKQGAGVQNLFTVLKVAGLAGLVGLAVVTGRGDTAHFLPLAPAQVSSSVLSALGVAMISTLFAYDGWHFVGFVAGEIDDPQRNVPRSILLGIFVVVLVYVAANLAYIFVLGQPRIASSGRVAADAMSAMIGPPGATPHHRGHPVLHRRRHLGERAGRAARVLRHGPRRSAAAGARRDSSALPHARQRHLGARRLGGTPDADRRL